jgi:hypothetical protein
VPEWSEEVAWIAARSTNRPSNSGGRRDGRLEPVEVKRLRQLEFEHVTLWKPVAVRYLEIEARVTSGAPIKERTSGQLPIVTAWRFAWKKMVAPSAPMRVD